MDEHSLCFYNDKGTAEIQGVVADEPDVASRSCSLKLSASEISIDGETQEVSGIALIQLPRYPLYHYGDVLQVTGELETPMPFDDFDYRSYLAQQGIYSVIYYPKVEILDRGQGFAPLEWLYALRGRLSDSLTQALPEPQGSLAQGILLGIRGNIPDSLEQAFSRTGTAHILAISGLHVGVVIGMVLIFGILLFGRRRSIYIWLALVTIWLYALLTGMHPPVVRAAIMGSLFLIAEYLGRQRNAITALAFAAAVMVGIQPQILWSVSFQLSFLAMAGLILFYPYFQAWGRRRITPISGDRESLTTAGNLVSDGFALSLAAIVATWPLIAYNFDVVSLVGLPATFFSLLALPAIIVTAAVVAFAGLFAPLLAQILGWLAWLFLSYLILVVQAFDALPFSSFQVAVQPWQLWAYYVALALIVVYLSRREQLTGFSSKLASGAKKMAGGMARPWSKSPRKWLVPSLLVVAILVWSALLTMPDEKLHVSFLDVGQGDAILVQQGSQQVLIDGGPDAQRINLELSEKLPFWDRTIELMVSTQPQSDHITGLVEVLERYNVRQVLEPGVAYDSTIYQQWLELVEQKQIKHEIAKAGQEIDLGNGLKLEILNPPAELFEGTSADVDNNGVVLRLSWHNVSFLFTADIRQETESELARQRANVTATVLKVAHHGSKTSTTSQFLAAVDPQIAVISVGANNTFGHPSPEVVERLIDGLGADNVYRTDEDGTIEFITDGERLWVRMEK